MKNRITYLLIISSLLESCYSYKIIDLKNTTLIERKTYKYNTEVNKKFQKISLKSFNDSIIIGKIGKKEKQIIISDIKSIKVRRFSVVKTIFLTPVIVIPAVIIGSGFKTGGYYSDGGNFNPP